MIRKVQKKKWIKKLGRKKRKDDDHGSLELIEDATNYKVEIVRACNARMNELK